jgi:SAM-dependent methyltransferase
MPAGLQLPMLKSLGVVGGGHRENSQCLVCGSNDKERLVYLNLKHATSLFQTGGRVLHVAPKPLIMKAMLQKKNVQYIRGNISASRADVSLDVTQIPFQNNTFDVLITNHVLEHVPDDKKVMEEILRVIKPNGYCILQVPIARALETTRYDANVVADEERLETFGQKDHVRLYGNDYTSLITEAGCDVDEVKWQSLKKLNPLQKNRYGLIEKETLLVCKPRIKEALKA